jgi:leucyl aminopeptidase
MEFFLIKGDVADVESDSIVFLCYEGQRLPAAARKIDGKLGGFLSDKVKSSDFKGAFGKTVLVDTPGDFNTKTVVLLGLGKKENLGPLEAFRAANIAVARTGQRSRTVSVDFSNMDRGFLKIFLEGMACGTYEYGKLKSSGRKKNRIEKVCVASRRISADYFSTEAAQAGAISKSVAFSRDLVNDPPNMLTPSILAEHALSISEGSEHLSCKVLGKEEIREMGMGGLSAVSFGSSEPPRFIHLSYSPPVKSRKKVAIVGKGITFDSGGLCLKPADSMRTMKMDMSGAAVVLGTMKALGELTPSINVHGIVPATENMTGASAYKPDDVVTALNGKTIEIINTDAEGRVALSDALSYAVRLGVSEIVDLATLTGACIVGLGLHNAGVMGNNANLVKLVLNSSRDVGEKMWELPLDAELREEIRSRVADVKNVGSRWGGAITAALFLENFVSDVPWVHIDIAGPSYVEKSSDWYQYGASGFGVRTIVNYLMKR